METVAPGTCPCSVLIDGGVRRPLICGFPENPLLVGSSALNADKEDRKYDTNNFWSLREREREREGKEAKDRLRGEFGSVILKLRREVAYFYIPSSRCARIDICTDLPPQTTLYVTLTICRRSLGGRGWVVLSSGNHYYTKVTLKIEVKTKKRSFFYALI